MKIETQRIELAKLNIVGVCTYIEDELKIINITHYLSGDLSVAFTLDCNRARVLFTNVNGNLCTLDEFFKKASMCLRDYVAGKEFGAIIKEFFGSGITVTILVPESDSTMISQLIVSATVSTELTTFYIE